MATSALAHAQLAVKGGGQTLSFGYNPTTVSLSKDARWEATSSPTSEAPQTQFIGSGPRRLSMQLFFDTRAGGPGSVWRAVETLFSWLSPTPQSVRKQSPQPPLLLLTWGSQHYLDACLREVRAQYTMFDPAGAPTRATVDVSLEEVATPAARQNPTSGGIAGRRSRSLVAGDTLASIAWQEYGDPQRWRALARVNGIDDPSRLRPGAEVLVPPLESLT